MNNMLIILGLINIPGLHLLCLFKKSVLWANQHLAFTFPACERLSFPQRAEHPAVRNKNRISPKAKHYPAHDRVGIGSIPTNQNKKIKGEST